MPALYSSSKRARLFANSHLEQLTLMSPKLFAISWSVLLPTIAWVGWGSAAPLHAVVLVLAGLMVWTLFEYGMHRFVFHFASKHVILRRIVFLMHGNHHENPNDRLRNMMPFIVSLPISAIAWATSLALLGASGTWLFLGWISGYVIYDAVHYACHQWPMKGTIGRALKRHHMHHHYVDEKANYAISAIFWDRILRTRITSLKR